MNAQTNFVDQESALEDLDSLAHQEEIVDWLIDEANALLLSNKYNQARSYFKKALNLSNYYGDIHASHEVYLGLAQIEFGLMNYENATRFTLEILKKTCLECNFLTKGKLHELLYKTYKKTNKPKLAFEQYQTFKECESQLYEQEKKLQMAELENYFQIKTKEKENLVLKETQQENLALIRNQTIATVFFFLIIFLLTSIAVMHYRSNRQKKKYNKELEKQVALRTQELRLSNAHLTKSNEELERFAYIASHDLKEPLRNISSYSKLLERRLLIGQQKEIKDYLNFVQTNAKQMHSLIEDVLQYSTITNATEGKKLKVVDLNEVLILAKNELGILINKHNAKILANDLPLMQVDRSNFVIIFRNLIENAIKYNRSSVPKITISTSHDAKQIHIHFADNGIGIDGEYFGRIFEMFKRLHNREEYEGSGLGLAICKKIINYYDGDISVQSRATVGSRFTISLPIELVKFTQKVKLDSARV